MSPVPEALRASIACGDFEALAAAYSENALLDASVQGRRVRRRGGEQIAAELERIYPGPGRVLDWDASEFADGLALWVERLGDDGGGMRQRQYLRYRDGVIDGHWIYSAPPRDPRIVPPAGTTPAAPASLLEPFGAVREQAVLDSTGWSGSRLESALFEDGRRLILKRIVPGGDWLASYTGEQGREGILFSDGQMGRFPACLDSAIRAAEFEGGTWWVAMDDVSDFLFGTAGPITREQSARTLNAIAGVWEEFRGKEVPAACSFGDRQVLGIAREPAAFISEFERCGTTLIHGDLRDEQLGIDGERVIAIDWGLASNAHPAYELAWYMMHCGWRIEAGHDEIVDDYRVAVGERDDPRALELGLISGLAQYGWILGNSALIHPDPAERKWASEELAWWVPRVRVALESTGVA